MLRPRESSADAEGRRESSNIEAAVLLAELVREGLKTICFCSVLVRVRFRVRVRANPNPNPKPHLQLTALHPRCTRCSIGTRR